MRIEATFNSDKKTIITLAAESPAEARILEALEEHRGDDSPRPHDIQIEHIKNQSPFYSGSPKLDAVQITFTERQPPAPVPMPRGRK